MSTIQKILNLHQTNLIELENLELNGYVNGYWWNWWFNFDLYLKLILESAKWWWWNSCDWVAWRSIAGTDTFSNIRDWEWTFWSATWTFVSAVILNASTTNNKFKRIDRGIFTFPTSSLPDNTVIESATLKLKWFAKSNALWDFWVSLVVVTPQNTNSVTASDYWKFWTTKFSSLAYADLTTWDTDTTFTLNASWIANINKTWVTCFWLRMDWDIDNSFWWTWSSGGSNYWDLRWADYGYPPILSVTYSVPLSNLKTWNWIAKSNIKTINWVAIANIKSIDSIT